MTVDPATPKNGVSKSASLYERALRVLPGGVSRNTVLRRPHPFYAVKGQGCWVTDIEGVRRLDFANNMCSLIHGHAHPAIVEALTRQLTEGTAFTFATEAEVLFAEHMCGRARGFEKIRFVNSGTEAVMSCIKAARAFTGREKIAKIEGAYHGIYDYAEVSQTSNPSNWGDVRRPPSVAVARGTPQGVLDDVVVIPFNDPGTAVAILNEHAGELACVLVDPFPHRVGFIRATDEYIDALRRWTTADGALLVFDEVITFRSEYEGAQSWYGAPLYLVLDGDAVIVAEGGAGTNAGATLRVHGSSVETLNPNSAVSCVPLAASSGTAILRCGTEGHNDGIATWSATSGLRLLAGMPTPNIWSEQLGDGWFSWQSYDATGTKLGISAVPLRALAGR